MTEAHNRWIISAHKFVEHTSIEVAEKELRRLSEKHPERQFRLYRIKRVDGPDDDETHT